MLHEIKNTNILKRMEEKKSMLSFKEIIFKMNIVKLYIPLIRLVKFDYQLSNLWCL